MVWVDFVIRKSPKHQETPIIVVSTKAPRRTEIRMSLGASAYLTKPFDESELVSLVTPSWEEVNERRQSGICC